MLIHRGKRTILLLKYIQETDFMKGITKGTTKMESYNSFCDWITFGGQTIMTGDPVEQEKRVKYTSLMANAIMLNNIVDLTKIIRDLRKEGYQISDEDLAHLSPYITFHIRRFGEYVLNNDNVPTPTLVKFLN